MLSIPLTTFTSSGMGRAAARFGIKQCERLGFVSIGTGLRHANTFRLVDGWRAVDAVEAEEAGAAGEAAETAASRGVAARSR